MNYALHLLIYFNIYAILALSLNLVVGYCGLLTLAHAGWRACRDFILLVVGNQDQGFFELLIHCSKSIWRFHVSIAETSISISSETDVLNFAAPSIPKTMLRKAAIECVDISSQSILFQASTQGSNTWGLPATANLCQAANRLSKLAITLDKARNRSASLLPEVKSPSLSKVFAASD